MDRVSESYESVQSKPFFHGLNLAMHHEEPNFAMLGKVKKKRTKRNEKCGKENNVKFATLRIWVNVTP